MFWMNLLKGALKRPWIFALIGMGILMAVQWTNIQVLKGDINTLDAKIVKIEKNFNTCKSNEVTHIEATDMCKAEASGFIANIELMNEQIVKEKKRVVYWRDKYNNKVCYDPCTDTITVKPDDVRILNDEKNVDAVNRINDLFNP